MNSNGRKFFFDMNPIVCAGLVISFLFIFGYSVADSNFSAQENTETPLIPPKITLDGKTFETTDIQNLLKGYFLDVALSYFIPGQNPQTNYKRGSWWRYSLSASTDVAGRNIQNLRYPPYFKQQYPWLYEIWFRAEGVPRFFAINKWNMPVKISLGFPNDLKPFNAQLNNQNAPRLGHIDTVKDKAIEDEVINEIELNLRKIKSATGLDVSYISPPKETAENYGNVRIILVNGAHYDSPFKRGFNGIALSEWPFEDFRFHLETDLLLSGVYFTPNSNHQVDGYFFSDKENNIKMAFCYISNAHPKNLIRGLVRECLVRAMGLPEAPYGYGGILSLWNKGYIAKQPVIPPLINEFDLFMLKLLYSPAIKSGMSIFDVQKLFTPVLRE